MLKVAMLSKWHVHAPEYARRLSEMDDVQLTCVWDEIPERGQAWAKELGTAFEPDLDKLLARDDVDAVCMELLSRILDICDTAYPELMRALWA